MDQNLDEKASCPLCKFSCANLILTFASLQAVRELEQELHTEIYPGTEIMVDVGTHHFVKSAAGTHSVLVPQPSDDQHDPLVSRSPPTKRRGS
jgi:hypothetical protein